MDIHTFRRTLLHNWPGTVSCMVQQEINQLRHYEAQQLAATSAELRLYYELVDSQVVGPLREEFALLSRHGIPMDDMHSNVFEKFQESINSRNLTSETRICMNCDREVSCLLYATHQKNCQGIERQPALDANMSSELTLRHPNESAMQQQRHTANPTDDIEVEVTNVEKFPQKRSNTHGHNAKRARLA